MVQKKINLSEEYLGWEHERFSIKRTLAFTLSHYAAPRHPMTRSALDTRRRVDVGGALRENAAVIAEALLRFLYELPDTSRHQSNDDDAVTTFLDSDTNGVQEELLSEWLDRLTSGARAAQLLSVGGTAGGKTAKYHPLVTDLLAAFDHYCHDARISPVNPDKKDPEYALYGASVDQMAAYRVKPAVFELVLALGVAAYLGLIYGAVLHVQWILSFLQSDFLRVRIKSA